MAAGIVGLGAGFVLLILGKVLTQRAIESRFGRVDSRTISQSTGTGVVPVSVSLIVLLGWALLAVGVIITTVSLL